MAEVVAVIQAASSARVAVRVFPAEAPTAGAVASTAGAAISMAAGRILIVDVASAGAILPADGASIVAEALRAGAEASKTAAEILIAAEVFATVTSALMAAVVLVLASATTRRIRTATPLAIAIRPDITIGGAIGAITPVATWIPIIRTSVLE